MYTTHSGASLLDQKLVIIIRPILWVSKTPIIIFISRPIFPYNQGSIVVSRPCNGPVEDILYCCRHPKCDKEIGHEILLLQIVLNTSDVATIIAILLSRSLRFPAVSMGSLPPQIKDMVKSKDDDGRSVLMHAVSSKNAAIFNAAITFVADHLNPQEVI